MIYEKVFRYSSSCLFFLSSFNFKCLMSTALFLSSSVKWLMSSSLWFLDSKCLLSLSCKLVLFSFKVINFSVNKVKLFLSLIRLSGEQRICSSKAHLPVLLVSWYKASSSSSYLFRSSRSYSSLVTSSPNFLLWMICALMRSMICRLCLILRSIYFKLTSS